MMKRFFSLLVSLIVSLCFIGCGATEETCTNHTFGSWTTTIQETCGKEGTKERSCSNCGKKETESIPKTSQHTFGSWTTTIQATCKSTGIMSRQCTNCNESETQTTPVTNTHNSIDGKCKDCSKITDAYDAFVSYVKTNGDYDYDDGDYSLVLGLYNYQGTIYTRNAFYNPTEKTLSISILYDSDYYLSININKSSSTYKYSLLADSYYMTGSFFPRTFSKNTTILSYSYTDISYSSIKLSCQELAASLAKLLLSGLNEDIKDSGVTAYMLGFTNY